MKLLENFKKQYNSKKSEAMSLEQYITLAMKDHSVYDNTAERMLRAIGEPKLVDTSKTPRLSRIFGNRTIPTYDAFKDFYGLEDVVLQLVSFFKHAAQNLEESRQILYLLGPVGSAKSSLVECLKHLMEQAPIYALADKCNRPSPVYESPLGILNNELLQAIGVTGEGHKHVPSPWATKRLEEYQGDITQFNVVKVYPSQLKQIAITKTEPGDDNNQDISTLVGKVDIRKLDKFGQDDPDAYSYSGGLCLGNQGILEFVEMFKAPIKMLHPLLTATQEHNYKGTEAIAAIPFTGIVIAHSNQSEWSAFKNNKNNEAFIDRVYTVEVPYCLRADEEVNIYKKLIKNSTLGNAPIAPNTLEMLAEFSILTRLETPENSSVYSKMRVYNGQNIKEKDVHAKSHQEYKDEVTPNEGFNGVSTRTAYKVLAEVFNYDTNEIAADPVHLLYVLEKTISRQRYPDDVKDQYLTFVKEYLSPDYFKKVEKDMQTSYLEAYSEYGQSIFDRYIKFSDHWVQDNDYRDPDTGQLMDRAALSKELEKIEKPAEIANPKDFRHEVVNFALRYQAAHEGKNPAWTAYEKLKRVIEANMFSKTKDLLPVISFVGQSDGETKKKHESFVNRMKELGYTERQVRRVVEWHMRATRS